MAYATCDLCRRTGGPLCSVLCLHCSLDRSGPCGSSDVPPFGICLLVVAALAFWYIYSLFHTLLTDRGTPRSAEALALGVIGLSYFLWQIVQTSIRSADYGFQTLAIAPVLFCGLVLSAALFIWIAFAERLGIHRQPTEP
jgi:hypothetical protein